METFRQRLCPLMLFVYTGNAETQRKGFCFQWVCSTCLWWMDGGDGFIQTKPSVTTLHAQHPVSPFPFQGVEGAGRREGEDA